MQIFKSNGMCMSSQSYLTFNILTLSIKVKYILIYTKNYKSKIYSLF